MGESLPARLWAELWAVKCRQCCRAGCQDSEIPFWPWDSGSAALKQRPAGSIQKLTVSFGGSDGTRTRHLLRDRQAFYEGSLPG